MSEQARGQHGYYVSVQDWPAGASDEDLSPDEIFKTLAGLDDYYEAAVNSLSEIKPRDTLAP